MPERPHPRPTLALAIDFLFDRFQATVWSSVVAAAHAQGVGLLCFLGGTLERGEPGGRRGRNAVYDLIRPATVDGILSVSGLLGACVDGDDLERFHAAFRPLPVVNLCGKVGDRPSVMVDNQAGVRDLLHHLIADHDRRRIAFIRGPPTSTEAELRFLAYREALQAHGLPFDPALVAQGAFDRASGVKAVRTLLDERRVSIDALVGANDLMTLYAMAELRRRGVEVPERVAVAGFDDILDSSVAELPLTTVRQPLDELGRTAVARMLALLRGEPAPPLELLPAELVRRASCGCSEPASSAAERARPELSVRNAEEAMSLSRVFQPGHLSERDFREALLNELPHLGIRSFLLCRYGPDGPRTAEVWARFDEEGVFPEAAPGPFPSHLLAPGGFRPGRPHAHVVLPLHYLEEPLGYAVCSIGPMACGSYEPLTGQISTGLKLMSLVDEVREHAALLEDKVAERTQELRDAQRQLLQTAHQAGMAEVAVGVMHNVGNLLNSVSVCAEQIAQVGESPHVEGLRKAVDLLAAQGAGLPAFFERDPRAALLPDYLRRVAEGLVLERARARDEAHQLLEKMQVIRDTIRALQDLARGGRDLAACEEVELPGVIDAVVDIQGPLLLRHAVVVRRELDPGVPPVVTVRAKLIHVLVNLVKNAVEAMRQTPGDRVLALRARLDGDRRVQLAVSDSGEGISSQDLQRIFSYGFTTKPDGHGFGLHTCALYAAHLGGSIAATSPGPGGGATFTLLLPLSSEAGA